MTRYARQFRRIARKLGRLELTATSMAELDPDPRALMEDRGPTRFLDFYGDEGLRTAFERYGFFDAVRRRGWEGLDIQVRADDERHTLIIEGQHELHPEPTHLVELVVRRDRLVPDPACELSRPFDVLTVDWLTLRNPAARFTPERPRLPGQDAPGLGLGEQVLELLYRVVDRLRLDGLLTVGEHFHNAVLYRRELAYFDPQAAGTCIALEDALLARERLTLPQASWAIDWGFVSEGGETLRWRGEAQLRAMAPELVRYMKSTRRRRAAAEEAARHSLAFDRGGFEARWAAELDVLEGRAPVPDDT